MFSFANFSKNICKWKRYEKWTLFPRRMRSGSETWRILRLLSRRRMRRGERSVTSQIIEMKDRMLHKTFLSSSLHEYCRIWHQFHKQCTYKQLAHFWPSFFLWWYKYVNWCFRHCILSKLLCTFICVRVNKTLLLYNLQNVQSPPTGEWSNSTDKCCLLCGFGATCDDEKFL